MKNVLYFQPSDATKFDIERYAKSLNRFAEVPMAEIKKAVKEFDCYENLHVSRLVVLGTALIMKHAGEDKAKEYFDEHDCYFGGKFERLRRITGYLVGTLDRWNDGKKAEEHARVKHSVNSAINDNERAARLQEQAIAHTVAYAA